jgi:diguanylate cyclase (GGDEF)-like protein
VTFVLYGGSDFHLSTHFVTGWKALGRELKVTRVQCNILYELDGLPAYETYRRYLNIKNDEHFFVNTVEFPFLYREHGIEILRDPVMSNPDGSIVMTSDIQERDKLRLAYGDPRTILSSVREVARTMASFRPEAIAIFSCAGRRAFWGDKAVDKELQPFELVAPTFGFFTSGEFHRTGIHVIQHNVTMVIAAMREGLPKIDDKPSRIFEDTEKSGEVSLVQRLSTFIDAATEDLNEANRLLHQAAITDALTGLKNRGETQRIIGELAERRDGTLSLLMLDLDNFKKVNDQFGHVIGDKVLVGLADHLRNMLSTKNSACSVGRWGGEEFMVVMPDTDLDSALAFAEKIRAEFARIKFERAGCQTMSVGVAQIRSGEDADALCIRVDDALYAAKRSGKNQVKAG